MTKQIKSILKEYDFNYIEEYYQYIVDSYINGNFEQSKRLYKGMKKEDQKEFIIYLQSIHIQENTIPEYFEIMLNVLF